MQQSQKWIMLTVLVVLGVYFGTHRTKPRKMNLAFPADVVSQDSVKELYSQDKASSEFIKAENDFLKSVNDLKNVDVEKVYPGRDTATGETSEMVIQENERREEVQIRLIKEVNDGQTPEMTMEEEALVRSFMAAEGVL